MNKNNNILLLIFILLIIFIGYKYIYSYKDKFKASISKEMGEYVAQDDGKLIFRYLVDPSDDYRTKINYYLNDDTKVNDMRLVFHPYQIRSSPFYGSTRPPGR